MAGVSNQMTTQRNPAFFNFVGGDGQVTVAEKRASDRGVAARGTSGVTSGRDRCKRGKACGATCIAGNEDCILDFPEPVQAELRRMAQYVLNRATKEGWAIVPGSEEDIQIGKGVGLLGSQLTRERKYQRGTGKYKKEVTERNFDTTVRGRSRAIAPSEMRDLKANRDKLGNAEFDEKARKALQAEAFSRGVNLDRKSLELIYDSLPVAAKTTFMGSGDPGKGSWYGKDGNGNDVTTLNNGTRDRGIAVLDMYIRQGGRDAYGNSKRVLSPADLDVEHIRPVSKGGLDHPSNWILARSGAQRQRANEELGRWIDKLPDPSNKAAMNKYYSDFAKDQQRKNAAKAAAAAVDPRKLPDADLIKVSPKNLRYMFNRDSFFQTGFYSPAGGTSRPNGAPPVPVSKAYGLVLKHNEGEAKEIRSLTKQIYNKNWFEDGGSTAKMTGDMINLYRQRLPAESFKQIEPQLKKWQAETLSQYPSGPPRVIGGSPSTGKTEKDIMADIDALLKTI